MTRPTAPAPAPGPSPAKQAIYGTLAAIAQAIGHPNRIELLEQLAQGQRSVEALAETCGLSFANTSRHLQILRRARLVETERQGKRVLYSLAGAEEVVPLLKALGAVGERNSAEIRQVMADYFQARDALAPVSREDLLARLHDDDVTIIDVRPEHEFSLGHLPGALNIPVEDLETELKRLPRSQEIVAYCRGPFCVMAFDAVAALRAKGYRVRRLEDGFPEWMAAGFEVETGPPAPRPARAPAPAPARRKPAARAAAARGQRGSSRG